MNIMEVLKKYNDFFYYIFAGLISILLFALFLPASGFQLISNSDFELLKEAKEEYFVFAEQCNLFSINDCEKKYLRFSSAGFSINEIYHTCMYIDNKGNLLFEGYCYSAPLTSTGTTILDFNRFSNNYAGLSVDENVIGERFRSNENVLENHAQRITAI